MRGENAAGVALDGIVGDGDRASACGRFKSNGAICGVDRGVAQVARDNEVGANAIHQHGLRAAAGIGDADRAGAAIIDRKSAHCASAGRGQLDADIVTLDQAEVVDRKRAADGVQINADQRINHTGGSDMNIDIACGRSARNAGLAIGVDRAVDGDVGCTGRKTAVGVNTVIVGCGQGAADAQLHVNRAGIGEGRRINRVDAVTIGAGNVIGLNRDVTAARSKGDNAVYTFHVTESIDDNVTRLGIVDGNTALDYG